MQVLQQVRERISRLLQTNEMKEKLASMKSEIERKALSWWDHTEELEELVTELEALSKEFPEFQKLKIELHSRFNLKKMRAHDNIDGDDSQWHRSSMQKTGQASNPYIVKILPTMAQLEM